MGFQEELQRTNLELDSYKEKVKENQEKIKLNKQLPYLVGNIVEVIFPVPLFFVSFILIQNFKLFFPIYGIMSKAQSFLFKHNNFKLEDFFFQKKEKKNLKAVLP